MAAVLSAAVQLDEAAGDVLKARVSKVLGSADPTSAVLNMALHLKAHVERAIKESRAIERSRAAEKALPPLLDVSHYLETLDLPTKERYRNAPDSLFDPNDVRRSIREAASRHGVTLAVNESFETATDPAARRADGARATTCELTVSLHGKAGVTGHGQGWNSECARRAAWLQVVSIMHTNGSLPSLFPSVQVYEHGVPHAPSGAHAEEVATVLDQVAPAGAEDAFTRMYESAASVGLIPDIEYSEVEPREVAGARLPQYRVAIRLPERSIDLSVTADTIRSAETVARSVLERQAERHRAHADGAEGGSGEASMYAVFRDARVAKEFLDHCRSTIAKHGLDIEVERESRAFPGRVYHAARVLIGGKMFGPRVTVQREQDATRYARLVAAVALSRAKPHLLRSYLDAKAGVSGGPGEELATVALPLDLNVVSIMRDGIMAARRAGLPDESPVLTAEDPSSAHKHRRGSGRRWHTSWRRAAKSDILRAKLGDLQQSPRLKDLRESRAALPVNSYREEILDMVNHNRFSIIAGSTGSGKSTQVPQILFDDAIARGEGASFNVWCTQPRRIGAVSVARRVADERDEPLQRSVGYLVRFGSRPPVRDGSITYCTTGVLLETMKDDADAALEGMSHIVLDEVHERDLRTDFLMALLKKAVVARVARGKTAPKVVLMSATLDIDLLAKHFGSVLDDGSTRECPTLEVPGRLFPVQESYLDDVFGDLQSQHGQALEGILEDAKTRKYIASEVAFSRLGPVVHSVEASRMNGVSNAVEEHPDPGEGADGEGERVEAIVPVPLVAATIAHLCSSSQHGAVLAFLPGMDELLAVQRLLLRRERFFGVEFAAADRFRIYLLHSSVSSEDQSRVFEEVPRRCRKIILATNIAETSVTIPDVRYVVDSGKLREKRYDQLRNITSLQTVWESRSNAKQRAGRAGRVHDGFYYAMFSRKRHQSFKAVGQAEILRSELQNTCLAIKAQGPEQSIAAFMSTAIEPPAASAVDAAVEGLKILGALTPHEELTPLGRVLSTLPLHPSLGKMVLLGIVFRCLDPMLILGAACTGRMLWSSPVGARDEAAAARASYNRHDSDQLAALEAFKELRWLEEEHGTATASARARQKFLNMWAFREIERTAKDISEVLVSGGLQSEMSEEERHAHQYGHHLLNRNSDKPNLLRALLLAGTYPNLAVKTSNAGASFRTKAERKVAIHPRSVNGVATTDPKTARIGEGALYCFQHMQRSVDGNNLLLIETSRVDPLAPLLFGGTIRLSEGRRWIEKDGWLRFVIRPDRGAGGAGPHAAKVVLEFRKSVDRLLSVNFHDLSRLKSGGDEEDEPEQAVSGDSRETGSILTKDPAREVLAESVIQVLERSFLEQE